MIPFGKTFIATAVLFATANSVFAADDLWGNSSDDLWGTSSAAKPAPVAEPAPAPVAEPAPAPVAEPEPAPVAEPVAAPVVEDSSMQESAVSEPAPVVAADSAKQDSSVAPAPVAVVDTAKKDSVSAAPAPVAAVDSAKKDSAVAAPAPVAAADTAKKDSAVAASAPVVVADSAKKDSSVATSATASSVFFSLGLVFEGSYGLFNVKLKEDHFAIPEFGGGLSLMFGYSHFALRLEGLLKYETVYVNEDIGSVNEDFWRLGGGAFVRWMSNLNSGMLVETGISMYSSLTGDIVLYEDESYKWKLGFNNEIPVAVSVGYKFAGEKFAPEIAVYGEYDVTKSVSFNFESENEASAWHVGLRLISWLY